MTAKANWANTYPLIREIDDLDALPPGTVVRAAHWGDVAVKAIERHWNGEEPPSWEDLVDPDESKFTTHVYWQVCGGGRLVSCDGPFQVIFAAEPRP